MRAQARTHARHARETQRTQRAYARAKADRKDSREGAKPRRGTDIATVELKAQKVRCRTGYSDFGGGNPGLIEGKLAVAIAQLDGGTREL